VSSSIYSRFYSKIGMAGWGGNDLIREALLP
jgi:hypothetical protein